jgi:hypothetical protein
MEELSLPAGRVIAGQLPQICTKHGQPASMTRKLRLISKPPAWARFLIILGALPYLIAVLATRKTVNATAWPFCAQCQSDRTRKIGIGLGVLALGLLLFFVGIATIGNDSAVGPLLFLVGFITLLVGIVVAAQGGWIGQARAFVSADGDSVIVRKPADAFAQQAYGATGHQQQQYNQRY